MKIGLLTFTTSNNTLKLSRALQQRLAADGHEVQLLDISREGKRSPGQAPADFWPGLDLLGIGAPVFHMRVPEPLEAYLRVSLSNAQPGLKAFLFLTYGGITTGMALPNCLRLLKKLDIPLLGAFKVRAPHFYSDEPFPDQAALDTLNDFCERVKARQYRPLSWEEAARLFNYQTRRVRLIYPLTHTIGRLRELPIRIDADLCTRCGRCVRECPTAALSLAPTAMRDKKACLYCYHCTQACPKGAITAPTHKVAEMAKRNVKVIGFEQPQNAVYLEAAESGV